MTRTPKLTPERRHILELAKLGALAELEQARERVSLLETTLNLIYERIGAADAAAAPRHNGGQVEAPQRRKISAAGRRAISKAQKARWRKLKAAKASE